MSGDIPRLLTALWDWGRCWTDCHGLRGCSSRHFWKTTQEVQNGFSGSGVVMAVVFILSSFFLGMFPFCGSESLDSRPYPGTWAIFPHATLTHHILDRPTLPPTINMKKYRHRSRSGPRGASTTSTGEEAEVI